MSQIIIFFETKILIDIKGLIIYAEQNPQIFFHDRSKIYFLGPQGELKEFEPRLKFEMRLKHAT